MQTRTSKSESSAGRAIEQALDKWPGGKLDRKYAAAMAGLPVERLSKIFSGNDKLRGPDVRSGLAKLLKMDLGQVAQLVDGKWSADQIVEHVRPRITTLDRAIGIAMVEHHVSQDAVDVVLQDPRFRSGRNRSQDDWIVALERVHIDLRKKHYERDFKVFWEREALADTERAGRGRSERLEASPARKKGGT